MNDLLERKSHLLVSFWVIVGATLRLFKLGSKPPWTDEFATVLYARGDDYSSIPINQIISASELLEPLQGYPIHGWQQVSELLIQQNNHPPLYFLIINTWQRLFPLDSEGYISISGVRYLSVVFGVVGIFSLYWVAKQIFKSEKIAQFSAGLMAFSPFYIYLSQEARHYTLIITFVILSLGYCLHCINRLLQQKQFSSLFIFSWVGLNICGLLIHYFFSLTLIAEAIALMWLLWRKKISVNKQQFLQLGFVVIGVGVFSLIWITQVLPPSYGSTMTDWIRVDASDWLDFVWPIAQLFSALVTMVFLLPIQVDFLPIILVSLVTLAIFSIQLFRLWRQNFKNKLISIQHQPLVFFLNRFVVTIWGLFGILVYGFGYDITRGARYSFVYFPAIILLAAITLSYFWQKEINIYFPFQNILLPFSKSGSQAIALILCCSFLGGISVVTNLAYQKPYDPTSIIQKIEIDNQPALILTAHKSTVQTGEMMAIAWEQYQTSSPTDISFALVPFQSSPDNYRGDIKRLLKTFEPETFKLWIVNLEESFTPDFCSNEQLTRQAGYYGSIYDCVKTKPTSSSRS